MYNLKLKCSSCQQLFLEVDLDICEDCNQLICPNCQVDYDNKLVFCQKCDAK